MRALFIIVLLAALILPSILHATGSPPIDISAENLQTLQAQAAQGNALAQLSLGVMYADGKGVPQDYATARKWYEKAAAQGNALAQYYLGRMYFHGESVSKDYTTARQWWEQAAAQGDSWSQVNLGWMYLDGQGVPKSLERAYMWFNLAVTYSTGDEQKFAVKTRNDVALRMSSAQIDEAQRLAQHCLAQQFKGC